MNKDYSISDVNEAHKLVNYLLSEYFKHPYYLKQTLREIKSLVHQADLKASKLIEADWFRDFNADKTLANLQNFDCKHN